jgi:GAF domain-containing protein
MAQVGKLTELIAPQYELSQMPTMGLLQRDEPTLAGDLPSDPNMDETTRDLIVNLLQARSAAFAPLVAGGQWIGYVGALWSLPQTFAEADVRRLRTLTSQAATVVQNIKQLTETQTRVRREQILREVTARVRGSTDPDTVMRTLARELGTALGRPTFVRLVTDKGAQEPEPSSSGGNGQRR